MRRLLFAAALTAAVLWPSQASAWLSGCTGGVNYTQDTAWLRCTAGNSLYKVWLMCDPPSGSNFKMYDSTWRTVGQTSTAACPGSWLDSEATGAWGIVSA